jgi:hypothetical protein
MLTYAIRMLLLCDALRMLSDVCEVCPNTLTYVCRRMLYVCYSYVMRYVCCQMCVRCVRILLCDALRMLSSCAALIRMLTYAMRLLLLCDVLRMLSNVPLFAVRMPSDVCEESEYC